MRRKLCQTITAVVLASVYWFSQTAFQHVDRIFVDGKIWTEDEARPQALDNPVAESTHPRRSGRGSLPGDLHNDLKLEALEKAPLEH